ncbi:MAG TPA: amphi-Trp domain-containing protein [Rubrivivax sp.]|nr:amphi-Trp domain-containing protein [Rubrivivax sp.]
MFEKLAISYVAEEGSPEQLYISLGFRPTGELDEGETIMELPLDAPRGPSSITQELPMPDRDIVKGYGRAQFVAKLRRLADAIESERAFTIQVAGERLRIPARAAFNIEHERSEGRQELEFQLLWNSAEA